MFSLETVLALVIGGLLYWFPIRRWYTRWGATDLDLARPMAGDAAVSNPTYATTLAVTIAARPEHVWPWLVQMGYRRGGLYSYDWLDRLFGFLDAPSAERIIPEYQDLEAGDVIPIGRGLGFPVATIEPRRTLVLGGEADGVHWSWELALYQLDDRRTRLVSRNRVTVPATVGSALLMCVIEPAAFIMTRQMLLGLKRRAEALGAETATVTFPWSRARRGRSAPGPRPRPVSRPHGRTLP
jgi:hypothetical protein